MALEATRPRLQRAKNKHGMSPAEVRDSKIQQWEQQKRENAFYAACRENLLALSDATLEISQRLILQHHFEPEVSTEGNVRLSQAVQDLNTVLGKSKTREADAEQIWRREWSVAGVEVPENSWI